MVDIVKVLFWQDNRNPFLFGVFVCVFGVRFVWRFRVFVRRSRLAFSRFRSAFSFGVFAFSFGVLVSRFRVLVSVWRFRLHLRFNG
jgi:hypothetical protein